MWRMGVGEGEREGERTSRSLGAWLDPSHPRDSGRHRQKGSSLWQRSVPARPYLQASGPDTHRDSMCATAPHQARRGNSQPSTQYSTRYPSMPPAPILSGGRHLRVVVVSVTSSTVRCWGSLVGAVRIQGKGRWG